MSVSFIFSDVDLDHLAKLLPADFSIKTQAGERTPTMVSRLLVHRPEKAMAPHSSTLAWKILRTEKPGRLQSMGSLRVGHD